MLDKLFETEIENIPISFFQEKKIMLMGRIEHVQIIKKCLEKRTYIVSGILDNDIKKQGMKIDGVEIFSPREKLVPYCSDIIILIYSPKYWEEILQQLENLEYQQGQQVFILDRPSEKKNKILVMKGYELYQTFQRKYGKDVMLFMANCPLGDYYLLGIFFQQYCQINHIDNYVMIGESAGIEKLSKILGITSVERLTIDECNALIRVWMFLGKDIIRLKSLTIWQGAFRFNSCLTRQKENFSFMDTFKNMIYHLPDEIEPNFPKICYHKEKIQQIFRENQLEPQKTILLSPFSYSMQSLSNLFWERLSEEITKKGYKIAVNTGDDRENNYLSGTVTLKLDFMTIMGVMEYAGTVIGMRSGFFDITAQAKCKRIILYPKTVEQSINWNSTDISFCSLKKMKLCESAFEWEVEDEEQMIKKILSVI